MKLGKCQEKSYSYYKILLFNLANSTENSISETLIKRNSNFIFTFL